MKLYFILMCLVICFFQKVSAQNNFRPSQPDAIQRILRAAAQPTMQLSPAKSMILFEHYGASYISVEKLAAEKIQLAGISFGKQTGFDTGYLMAKRLSIKRVNEDYNEIDVTNLPDNPQLFSVKWSPDGSKIAFCQAEKQGVSLWYLDTISYRAQKIADLALNFSMEYDLYKWMPDSKSLVCVSIPSQRNYPQKEQKLWKPIVLEHEGKAKPNRTYQGLLENSYDEKLFDYYATSQMVLLDLKGNKTHIGDAGVVLDFDPSPNSNFILVSYAQRPYSYLYTVYNFPSKTNVYKVQGELIWQVDKKELDLRGGVGRDATYTGPQDFAWRHDTDATLFWTEALDGGNPDSVVLYRNVLKELPAPFNGHPSVLGRTSTRFSNIYWGNDTVAIVEERWWKDRKVIWTLLNPSTSKIIDTLSVHPSDGLMGIPGNPYMINTKSHPKLSIEYGKIYLSGHEYDSTHAVLPVLKSFELRTKIIKELWRSSPPNFETFLTFLSDSSLNDSDFLFSRQSQHSPSNFVKFKSITADSYPVTFNKNVLNDLDSIRKEDLLYLRQDSIQLYGTLYYQKRDSDNSKLPLLIWAYPVNYKTRFSANQVQTSPYLYTGNYSLQQLLALRGYAVLDFASFPILGEDDVEPNDSYMLQLRMNAQAALQAAHQTGLVDTSRAAIAGHSYGAFMAANILTHTNFFKTAIAQSGAYNRSLTPFGFQSEYRTYWEAQELYHEMSPFQQAEKLKYPILLFHGANDNNPGTLRFQSERYFEALKGLGKRVKYITLPYEEHVYQSEETKIYLVEEMDTWLYQYLQKSASLN